MDLEAIMLSEISQTEKDKHCLISLIYGVKKIQQPSKCNNNNKNKQSHRWRELVVPVGRGKEEETI